MYIIPINEKYRNKVIQIIKEEWAGPFIVAKGKVHDATILPGFVCIENDIIIGVVLYNICENACEIAAIISYKENQGVGTSLLKTVINLTREEMCKRVWLITTNDNTHAIRYYQKIGFELKAVYINSIELSRKLKPEIPVRGLDGIPILHEFEFELKLDI